METKPNDVRQQRRRLFLECFPNCRDACWTQLQHDVGDKRLADQAGTRSLSLQICKRAVDIVSGAGPDIAPVVENSINCCDAQTSLYGNLPDGERVLHPGPIVD